MWRIRKHILRTYEVQGIYVRTYVQVKAEMFFGTLASYSSPPNDISSLSVCPRLNYIMLASAAIINFYTFYFPIKLRGRPPRSLFCFLIIIITTVYLYKKTTIFLLLITVQCNCFYLLSISRLRSIAEEREKKTHKKLLERRCAAV